MFLNPKRRRRKTRRVTARRARRMTRNPIRRRRRRTRRTAIVPKIIRHRRRKAIRAYRRRRAARSFSRRIRRYAGRNGNLTIKSLMQREYLTMAAGAVAAGVLTPMVLAKLTFLPGRTTTAGQIAYSIGLPVAGALIVQKFNKDFAKGMLLAGIVVGVNSLLEKVTAVSTGTATVAATKAYLDYMPRRQIAGAAGPGYSAVNSFNAPLLSNASAFSDDPWAVSR